jgi:hypothetical protein
MMSVIPYHAISTQDLLATFVPPLAKLVGCGLRIAGFAYGLSARIAQAALGVWRPHSGN